MRIQGYEMALFYLLSLSLQGECQDRKRLKNDKLTVSTGQGHTRPFHTR